MKERERERRDGGKRKRTEGKKREVASGLSCIMQGGMVVEGGLWNLRGKSVWRMGMRMAEIDGVGYSSCHCRVYNPTVARTIPRAIQMSLHREGVAVAYAVEYRHCQLHCRCRDRRRHCRCWRAGRLDVIRYPHWKAKSGYSYSDIGTSNIILN